MSSKFLNILTKYTLALIFVMFIKTFIIDHVTDNGKNILGTNEEEIYVLEYSEVEVLDGEETITKVLFNEEVLDGFVDDYIHENSCDSLEYDVSDLGDDRVNVFLNCGDPKSLLYEYVEKEELSLSNISFDVEGFESKVRELLSLKYPKFVADDVDFSSAVYNIKSNELVGYYKTSEYGDVTIRINYNEIPDMFDIPMSYDEEYENEVFTLDPKKKTIAFTFDDGPSDYDINLVNLLVESHSSATFYVVGNRIANFPTAIKKIVDAGMEVGSHTYNHKSLTSQSNAEVLNQLSRTNDAFNKATGNTLKTLRPPYGSINNRVLSVVGVPVILWSIDTLDWSSRNADKVYNEIMTSEDGDIVLMHSLYSSTVEAVGKSLKELYKRGYQVVSVSTLSELKGKTLTPGVSYTSIR